MSITTKTKPPVVKWFKQWLTIRDEAEQLKNRTEELRTRLLEAVDQIGEEDDRGNVYLELTSPVEFCDSKGRVFQYTTLKRERHLRPANPLPDPELTEDLLRELKLWLKPDQEKAIEAIQIANPYVTITVEVDPDAVAQAYFKGVITEEQYDSLLQEQTESFQFRIAE